MTCPPSARPSPRSSTAIGDHGRLFPGRPSSAAAILTEHSGEQRQPSDCVAPPWPPPQPHAGVGAPARRRTRRTPHARRDRSPCRRSWTCRPAAPFTVTVMWPATRRYPTCGPLHRHERAFGRVIHGQCSVVGLPACQQRALDGIESALRACEPRLASMFAIFTRLARDEAVPRTESLRARTRLRWSWLGGLTATSRTIMAVPLVLGFMVLLVFLAMNRPAAHGCGPVSGLRAAAVAQARSCQAAPESPGR